MIRRSFRIGLWLGLLAGIGFALAKIFRPKPEPSAVLDVGRPTTTGAREWPPLEATAPTPTPTPAPAPVSVPVPEPEPEPERAQQPVAKKPAVKKKAAAKKAEPAKAEPAAKTLPPWVDPDGNICPETHPVKGKLSSKIFQVEGNFAYWRTNPDRCYESAEAALDDGLRPAKR